MAVRDCLLDVDRFELQRNGQLVSLEPRAMRNLIDLINQRDRVVANSELLDSVWGDRFVREWALTMFIARVDEDTPVLRPAHGRKSILAVLAVRQPHGRSRSGTTTRCSNRPTRQPRCPTASTGRRRTASSPSPSWSVAATPTPLFDRFEPIAPAYTNSMQSPDDPQDPDRDLCHRHRILMTSAERPPCPASSLTSSSPARQRVTRCLDSTR
jgi:hypothetical protein